MSSKINAFLPGISSYSYNSLGDILRCNGLNPASPASTAWGTANLAVYMPFFCPTLFKFSNFTWRNGATISGNLDVGVYSADGRKIISTGSIAQAAGANAIQTASVATTSLGVGLFYFAMTFSSATATVFSLSGLNAGVVTTMGIFNQGTALPLPATFTLADPTILLIPILRIN